MMKISEVKYSKVDPEKGLTIDFGKIEDIELVGLSDIHFGSVYFDKSKFLKAIEYILEKDNRYVFFNGDQLEFVPPNYEKITQRDQLLQPDQQVKDFVKLIEPIKNRILWIKGGNHDTDRGLLRLGFDPIDMMAVILNVPYYPSVGFITIKTKKRISRLVVGHGCRASKNSDLELTDMKAIYSGADVYYLGHDHSLYAKPVDSLKFTSSEHMLRQWFVRGGTFLKFGGYARDKNYSLKRIGFASILIKGKELICETH